MKIFQNRSDANPLLGERTQVRASVKKNHASGPASFLDRPKHLAHARFMPLAQNTLSELRRLVGTQNVLTAKEDLIPYSFDGTAALKQMPGCVVFATTPEQVRAILKLANQTNRTLGEFGVLPSGGPGRINAELQTN